MQCNTAVLSLQNTQHYNLHEGKIYIRTVVSMVLAGAPNKVATECDVSAKLGGFILYFNIID